MKTDHYALALLGISPSLAGFPALPRWSLQSSFDLFDHAPGHTAAGLEISALLEHPRQQSLTIRIDKGDFGEIDHDRSVLRAAGRGLPGPRQLLNPGPGQLTV